MVGNAPSAFSSTNGISFSGLASGINTSQLINSLVAFESATIKQPLLNKKSVLQAKLSALDSLKTKLSAIQTKATALDTTSEFLVNKASSSNTTLVSATADGSAVAGSHSVVVKQLAQAESESNATALSNYDTTTAGTGTLVVTYAGTANNITITNGTLNGIAAAINGAGIGVSASVVNVNTPASPQYKLVLQGADTGATKTISVDATGLSNNAANATLGAFSNLVAAANSKFDVDGITDIQRLTNSVSDVLPGVTLNLLKVDPATVSVTVSQDTSGLVSKIQEFVTAFNDAASFIKTQKTFKQGSAAGPLFGDLALSLASNKLSSIISGVQNNSSTTAANLAQIGITSKTDGTLSVDSTKLEDAIDANASGVAKLFATGLTGGGVAVQLKTWLDGYLSTANTGLIQAEKDSINATIKDLDDRILLADARLTKLQDGLTKKYTALEAVMSKLQGQQTYLGAVKF